MPLLALGSEYSSDLETFESWKPTAENLEGGVIKNAGHYISVEQPKLLLESVWPFLSNSILASYGVELFLIG